MKPRVNQEINLTILDLGINGEGVGRWHGFTVFVDNALPGEVIEGRLYDRTKKFGRAKATSIKEISENRTSPICPLFERCGGCQLMHMKYEAQLEFKRQHVIDSFRKIGQITDVSISPCQGSPKQDRYRNKIQLPIRQTHDGLEIGLYARNSHELIPIDYCYVHSELGETAYGEIRQIIKQSSLPAYNLTTGEGIWRFLLIKSAVNTNEVLVTFVTNACEPKLLQECAEEIMKRVPTVKGVVQNVNSGSGNAVLGSEYRLLAGQSFIHEKLSGLTFKISPASFFQVNPWQAEKIYEEAIKCAALQGSETVMDAYCGVGTLSLFAAKRAGRVIGVESVPEAIQDAIYNANLNKIKNVEFICALSEEYILGVKNLDVLLLNPPRKGCDPLFLEKVVSIKPKRIVYVSCDPGTLARDLHILRQAGYRIQEAFPFDMFPQTAHVETVVSLSCY